MATIGERQHWVLLYSLGASVPDGQGGFTQAPVPLTPAGVYARIQPASQRDLERVVSGTVLSDASHIVTMPYHAQVDTATVIVFNGRQFNVKGVSNPSERNIETVAVCTEQLGAPTVTAQSSWMQSDWLS